MNRIKVGTIAAFMSLAMLTYAQQSRLEFPFYVGYMGSEVQINSSCFRASPWIFSQSSCMICDMRNERRRAVYS
jgi:hypothetical protein